MSASPQTVIDQEVKQKKGSAAVFVKAKRRIAAITAIMKRDQATSQSSSSITADDPVVAPMTTAGEDLNSQAEEESLSFSFADSMEQSLHLISEHTIGGETSVDAGGSPTIAAVKRSNKVKSLINLFTNSGSKMIAADAAAATDLVVDDDDDSPVFATTNLSPISATKEICLQTDQSDGKSPPTPATDFSFEHALDTIINVSDDILNLSVEDACIDLAPIAKSLTSSFKREMTTRQADARTKIGDALERYDGVYSNQGDFAAIDDDDNYSSLIRDIESAPTAVATTGDAPVCRLDFSSEADAVEQNVVKRKVVIQDDLNTVRYFSRSKEERAFVGRAPMSRPKRHYSAPLPDDDSPLKKSFYKEGTAMVGAMSDIMSEHMRGVEEGGNKLRDEVKVHTGEFLKWAESDKIVEKLEATSSQLTTSLKEASTKFNEACLSLKTSINSKSSTEAATDEFGFPVVQRPRSFSQSLEESTSKLKATIEESSNSILRTMSGETIMCLSRRTTEEASEGVEAPEFSAGLEAPLHEEMMERAFSEPLPFTTSNSSPSKIQDFGISMAPLDDNIFHKDVAADISSDSHPSLERSFSDPTHMWSRTENYAESAVSEGGRSTEIMLRPNGKVVLAEEGSDLLRCQSMKPDKVDLRRKRNVVNGARRWNMKQQTPTDDDKENKSPVFLELDEPRENMLQPNLFDDRSPSKNAPVTPTTRRSFSRQSNKSLSSDKTATFRKAAEFFKRMDIAKDSPVSAIDL